MDEEKILKLNISEKTGSDPVQDKLKKSSGMLHTNPIISKMFTANLLNKSEKKFKLSDLFK